MGICSLTEQRTVPSLCKPDMVDKITRTHGLACEATLRRRKSGGTSEPGRMIPVERIAGDPGKNSHLWGFHLPPGTANDPAGPRRGPLRIPAWTHGIIRRVIPIGDPLPDVARHIVDPVGALALFIHPNRNEGLFTLPGLVEIQMPMRRFDVPPREPSIIGPSPGLLPFRLRSATACPPIDNRHRRQTNPR